MPFSFPAAPTLNQQSTQNGRVYAWDGATWVLATELAAHTHAASDITSGTLPDARLSTNVPILPAFMLGWHQPSGVAETAPRVATIGTAVAPISGQILFAFFTPVQTITVSQLTIVSGTVQASGLTLARMGLFTTNETALTLVARTASDTSLFTGIGVAYTRAFSTDGGFPSTYTLQAGTRYGVGVLQVGTTVSNYLGGFVQSGVSALTPRVAGALSSQSDLADVASFSTVASVFYARLT